jgi:general L-amino acid transport system substrate-binding protein
MRKCLRFLALSVVGGLTMSLMGTSSVSAADGDTLAAIKQRGEVICGVYPSRPGFAAPDSQGTWVGFNVDFCRALAAAIFDDASKVRFEPISSQQRFPAIQSGEVDVLSRNISVTLGRDTALGLTFGPPIFYTGTQLMVRKDTGATSVRDLDGVTICLAPGGTTEGNLTRYFSTNGMSFKPVVIDNAKQLDSAYIEGRCDARAGDGASLPAIVAAATKTPQDHVMLPEQLSKEPLAMTVRRGDDQWANIVKWISHALLNAEELGVTQANVDAMLTSADPDIQQLLGVIGEAGTQLGLELNWAYRAIKQVGNYEEIYDRHFGPESTLPTPRGLNALYTEGGIMYGFPLQ